MKAPVRALLLIACLQALPLALPSQRLDPMGRAHAQAPSRDQTGSPEVERRLRVLSDELRCMVCQNQTLADSNADLAIDLRNQVRDLVSRGMNDDEVKRWLVDRYGDFVLYRPPVQGNTWLLWFGPFGLLVAGGAIWAWVSRQGRRRAALGSAVTASGDAPPGMSGAAVKVSDARRLLDD